MLDLTWCYRNIWFCCFLAMDKSLLSWVSFNFPMWQKKWISSFLLAWSLYEI
jgi:hypothetical protein